MVDLRSDTISMPTREMLGTILEAKLGDDGRTDSRGRGEDLAVNELEDLAAEMTGKKRPCCSRQEHRAIRPPFWLIAGLDRR